MTVEAPTAAVAAELERLRMRFTVPVIAQHRLHYVDRVVVPGELFMCDEVTAAEWLKSAAVKKQRKSILPWR